MRILFVSGSFPPMPCGVGAYTARLVEAMDASHRYRIGVLTTATSQRPSVTGAAETLEVADDWSWKALWPLARRIRAWKPDVVHIQYPTQAYGSRRAPWILPALLRLLRVPTVQTWHEFLPPGRILRAAIAFGADRIIVVRPRYEESLGPRMRRMLAHARMELIPNAPLVKGSSLSEEERIHVKRQYAPHGKNLVVYFGFMYPHKGVERLFEIADPSTDHLVIAGQFDESQDYHRLIRSMADSAKWKDSCRITGYLSEDAASRLLASADAVVFPFVDGAGPWNTSLAAVQSLGTLVVTTAAEPRGYDEATNTVYCAPSDIAALGSALRTFIGRRKRYDAESIQARWSSIADAHAKVYEAIAGKMRKAA